MKRSAKIDDILKPLEMLNSQAYISNALQVADVFEWMITQFETPPQDVIVYQSTFSISEEFLRRMYFIKRRCPGSYRVIIDRKALQKTVSLWKFISQVYDSVYVSDNHSKILIVESQNRRFGMITSQNLTRGNRAESAVVSCDRNLIDPLLADFLDLAKNNSVPMHEIYKLPSEVRRPEDADNEGLTPCEKRCQIIERLAGYFVPIADIAVMIDVDVNELRMLIADTSSPESVAYNRGKVAAKVAIKAQEMELAKIGSPLGIQSVRENLLIMDRDED